MEKSKGKNRIIEFFKPTKAKIIPLVILLVLLELFSFYNSSRVSYDCFGTDCNHTMITIAGIIEEIFLDNIFFIIPIIIILYLLFCIIGFIVYHSKNRINKK